MLDERAEQNAKIKELVERAFSADDEPLRGSLADEILSMDPDNPVAKFIKWENMDEEESLRNIAMLEEAYESLRTKADGLSPDAEEYEAHQAILVAMLSNLASCEYFNGNKERALAFAEEFMDLDDEGLVPGRVIYYALLIEMAKYEEAIDAADTDFCETPIGEHARAIALFEKQGPSQDAVAALMEAILLDPDMVFFILGMWELDEETEKSLDEDEADDFMMQIAVLADLWSETDDRLAFIGSIAFSFGYITGRVEDRKEIAMLEDSYRSLDCLDEMISAKRAVEAMTASGRDLGDADEEALSRLQELIERGIFS